MKVAIFEPFPRVAGITTWAFELVNGFRDLGHEAHVVSCTKSGRPKAIRSAGDRPRRGWQWFDTEPDRVFTWTNAVSAFNEYDLIVLNEPKNNPLDAPAKRGNYTPEYIELLSRVKTPWVTAFHDGTAYRADKAPFLAQIMALPNFSGVAIECRPGAYASAAYASAGRVTKLVSWPWLPYTLKYQNTDLVPVAERPPHIGMTGRMVTTKGFTSMLAVADQIMPPYETRIYGSESGGMAPARTFDWFETMVMNHGWKGLRGDPNIPSDVRTQHSVDIGNFAPMNTVIPYGMRHPGGAIYRYMGQYVDRMTVYNDLQVMLMLSRQSLATTLEYAALEALDAGCVLAAPKYVVSDMRGADYDIIWIDYDQGVSLSKNTGFRWIVPSERESLIEGINRAIDTVSTYDPTTNRTRLEMYHAPRHLANAILEAL